MRLFNLFKSNDFASMDEIEQMNLADGLGITDIKNDVQSIKKQLTDLEASSNWQDNIITAEEATAQLEAKIQAEMPKELGEVFKKIRKAIDDKKNSIKISPYNIQYERHDNARVSAISYNPYLEDLEQELKKYNYATHLTDYGLVVAWPRNKANVPVIDPDKKYILPMEGTVKAGLPHQTLYAFRVNDTWVTSLETEDAKAIGNMQYVYGKNIIDAPDWVKAIKPIEVKE
ncbi:hypothetical protein [Limosilactobacillus reuteri]|uniref:hypothetical protein n=1 Tax=Limosilactobacillus reuteri TaxID=1598 RepID=UPI001E527CB2|nr:hypothetical protein [Limosilactobacillus reuteri]MCC4359140.1 hypothetical protein [Limosilactobacillus reuteri]MCC4361721.1 hypothetical protein [Limosilactobacillus reuteri]MCC4365442.1 hypothetical protein [Limosilactobacillus reuteri]